jgi:hypothetical protein
MEYQVITESDEYGEETFGPYASLDEAQTAINRIKAEAEKLNDGVERRYFIEPLELVED